MLLTILDNVEKMLHIPYTIWKYLSFQSHAVSIV